MLSSFFHVPCSNGSAEASISIHALLHHPQRLAMNEKTLSQRQTQLTLGMGMMLRSPANFKLLKFMPFPRFWTWFLFLAPLRPFSSLLPLPPCFVAFFLMAKLTYADLRWLFINSPWTPKHHEQSFPFSLQEHSKCSETYFRHNSSLWRCVQAFVRVYWQEVVFHGSNQEGDDGGGGSCQAGEAVPCITRPCIPGMRVGFPQPPTTQLHSSFSRGEKCHGSLKRGKLDQRWVWAGERGGETSVICHGYGRRGCFWSTPWPWRAGVRHKAPVLSFGGRLCWGMGQQCRFIPFCNLDA